MTVHPEAEVVRRWLQPDSDASSELRELTLQASVLPDDGARIARLRDRLGPWLAAGTAAEMLRAELQAPQPATVSAAEAATGAGTMLKAAGAALAASVAITSAFNWLGPADPPQRGAESAGKAATAASVPSLSEARDGSADQAHVARAAQSAEAPASSAHPSRAASPLAPSATQGSLAEQVELLSRARGLLEVAPTEALQLLSLHARRFPRSTLSEERRLFTVQALVGAGRISEAQRELEHFEESSPSSPHLTRARRMLSAKSGAP